MVELRPYQVKFVEDIKSLLQKKNVIIASAPTGSGKLHCLADMAANVVGSRVLIVTSRVDTIEYIKSMLDNYKAEYKISCVSFSNTRTTPSSEGKILLGTVQTVSHFLLIDDKCYGKFDFIFVDEFVGYDRSESFKIVKQSYPEAKIVYFTNFDNNVGYVNMVGYDE